MILTPTHGSCSDGKTCPDIYRSDTDPGVVRIVGTLVTDPAELAQMGLGAGEVAVRFPAALLPGVTA